MMGEEESKKEQMITDRDRENFFHTLGGRDNWTAAEKAEFWSRYDDTDVSLAFGVGAI